MSGLRTGTAALVAALTEERGLYGDLVALTQREETAIVGGDVRALTTIVDEKEQLLELLAALETERMTALTAVAAALGQAGAPLEFGDVLAVATSAERDALLAVGAALREQASALQQANDRNAQLLRGSQQLVDRWIQYLRTVIGGSLTYNPHGAAGTARTTRVLDRSA